MGLMSASGGKDLGAWQYANNCGSATDENGEYFALSNIPEGRYSKKGYEWAPEIRYSLNSVVSYLAGIASTNDSIRIKQVASCQGSDTGGLGASWADDVYCTANHDNNTGRIYAKKSGLFGVFTTPNGYGASFEYVYKEAGEMIASRSFPSNERGNCLVVVIGDWS